MTYDSDRHGSWDYDTSFERDQDREPRYPSPRRRQLDERGSVRVQFVDVAAICSIETHDALKADPIRWAALDEPKYMPAYNDDDQPMVLECRNCTCGSTLAKMMPATTEQALAVLRREGLL